MTTLASATPTQAETDRLNEAYALLSGRRFAVLTGAGLSTDSGIPDYRGAGAPKRTPMSVSQFLLNDASRKRYWAGSHLGWALLDAARPNAGHAVLATLEAAGFVTGIVTQNVDGLHVRAGSRRVVDLHGSMDRVSCLVCGQTFARASIAARIDAENPWLSQPDAVTLNPDGDAEVAHVDDFIAPVCSVCGGALKPDVVFFGEFVPSDKFAEARDIVSTADVLVIAGSSLVVNSGIRLLEHARRNKMPIIIINRGMTKGDGRADVKLDAGASETLTALAERLLVEQPLTL